MPDSASIVPEGETPPEPPELQYYQPPEESPMVTKMRAESEAQLAEFEKLLADNVGKADAKSALMADKGVPEEKRSI